MILALPVVAAALVAVIFAFVFFQLFKPVILGIAHIIPLVGGGLARLADLGLSWAYGWVRPWVNEAITAIHDVIDAPSRWVHRLVDGLNSAIRSVYQATYHLGTVVIPRTFHTAVALAQLYAANAERYAAGLVTGVQNWAAARLAALQAWTSAEIAAAFRYAAAQAAAVEQYAARGLAADAAYAERLATGVQAYAAAGIAGAERYAEALATGVQDYAAAGIKAVEDYAGAQATRAIDYTIEQIRAANGYAEALAAGVETGVLAKVDALAQDVAAEEEGCIKPLCNNLGNWAKILQDLGGVFDIGALLALAADAAADPAGVAGVLDEVVGAPARDIADGIRSVIGI